VGKTTDLRLSKILKVCSVWWFSWRNYEKKWTVLVLHINHYHPDLISQPAGAGISVLSVTTFASEFYTGGCEWPIQALTRPRPNVPEATKVIWFLWSEGMTELVRFIEEWEFSTAIKVWTIGRIQRRTGICCVQNKGHYRRMQACVNRVVLSVLLLHH
jgi:hypothetical protein